ncbi:Uma2 family endonuclease [Candidatus Venteria ishoeyi]|nr:Uma2 family endonuclease [Candidatus Venteria ishoeyi]
MFPSAMELNKYGCGDFEYHTLENSGINQDNKQETGIMDFQAYLDQEKLQQIPNEWVSGQLYAQTEPDEHSFALRMNLAFLLNEHLSTTDYQLHVGDVRLYIEAADSCVYPDLFVSAKNSHSAAYKKEAQVILEILAPDNEAFKRGLKFSLYRQLPQLSEYILIDSKRQVVDIFRFNQGQWFYYPAENHQRLALPSLNFECGIDELYQDVFD